MGDRLRDLEVNLGLCVTVSQSLLVVGYGIKVDRKVLSAYVEGRVCGRLREHLDLLRIVRKSQNEGEGNARSLSYSKSLRFFLFSGAICNKGVKVAVLFIDRICIHVSIPCVLS